MHIYIYRERERNTLTHILDCIQYFLVLLESDCTYKSVSCFYFFNYLITGCICIYVCV